MNFSGTYWALTNTNGELRLRDGQGEPMIYRTREIAREVRRNRFGNWGKVVRVQVDVKVIE